MKGIVIHSSKDKQICLCGVKGAGKKTFCSLFIPDKKVSIKNISLRKNIKKMLIIILFDGIHQQNLAEENVINEIQDFMKATSSKIKLEIWGVLTKVDAFYNKRKDSSEIMRMYLSYKKLLNKRNIILTYFIPLAQIACYYLLYILKADEGNSEEECLNLLMMLGRIGIRFTEDNDFVKLKDYVQQHKGLLMNFTGYGIIKRHLLEWT